MNKETQISLVNEVIGFSEIPRNLLKEEHILQIVTAIQDAYNHVKTTQKEFKSFKEIELNTFVHARISHLIDTGHKLRKVVESVGRGGETINYNAKNLEKRPDLCFKIQSSIQVGKTIIVEAKIVFQKSKNWRMIELYCQNGINRFVFGDYAWDESEAIMIGYVKDNSTINQTLTPFLKKAKKLSNSKRFAVKIHPTVVPKLKGDVAYTVHDRNFSYVHKTTLKPGPIKIWHIWLK